MWLFVWQFFAWRLIGLRLWETLVADIFNAYYAMKDGTLTVDEAAAESLAQPETAADAAAAPADGTADPAAGEAEDAGQNDAAAAPADAAAAAGA